MKEKIEEKKWDWHAEWGLMAGERAGRQSFFAQFSRAFAKNVFAAGANVIAIANANVIAIAIASNVIA